MNAVLPDNEVNKEIASRLHNSEVDGLTFPLYVSRVTSGNPKQYFLINTQLNNQEFNKCGNGWENSTEIQVIVRQPKNTGSKVLLNNATQEVLSQLADFSLPSSTGLKVNRVELSVANELVDERGNEIVYQKIIRLETSIR